MSEKNEWKLVPMRATKAMQDAWDTAPFNDDTDAEFHGAYAAMIAAAPASAQPERDWELTCEGCDGDGFVYVERRVGPFQTDIQTFKEECECCEGRGFTIAFEDIPGIAEYVKSCRAPSAPGDAQDERRAFEAWLARRGVWPALCFEEVFIAGWNARPVDAPAAGDAQIARQLLPKLQSLLDRMANDPHTGTMFEADGDTLRDAMHLCRSVVVDAASQQQEG